MCLNAFAYRVLEQFTVFNDSKRDDARSKGLFKHEDGSIVCPYRSKKHARRLSQSTNGFDTIVDVDDLVPRRERDGPFVSGGGMFEVKTVDRKSREVFPVIGRVKRTIAGGDEHSTI